MVSGIASIKPHLSERAMISYLQRSHAKEVEVDCEKTGHVRDALSIKRGMSRKRYQRNHDESQEEKRKLTDKAKQEPLLVPIWMRIDE